MRVIGEIDELLADGLSTEETILRLENRVAEKPNEAWQILGDLYCAAGRFKDAEGAYIKEVEGWPNVFFPHHHLGLFYLNALGHSLHALFHTQGESWLSTWADLTLQDLSHSYEQAHRLAEEHFREALKLAPPKPKFHVQ
jgi:tetratricopeptide (TPR) repeat protein